MEERKFENERQAQEDKLDDSFTTGLIAGIILILCISGFISIYNTYLSTFIHINNSWLN